MRDRRLLYQWVRATWTGWVLGVPLIVALALVGEAIGIGGVQVLVGAGMGAGVGLLQARAIRGVLNRAAPWFWSCAGGLAVPFLATDIAKAAGWSSAFSLYACVALGGVIAGVWQAILLRPRLRHARWWVVASALGWILAGGTAAVADALSHWQRLRGIWGAVAYLGIVAAGGLILGLITGVSLVRLLRREAAVDKATQRAVVG